MRLVSYRNGAGPRIGARAAGGLVDLGAAAPGLPTDVVGLLEGGGAALLVAREALEFAATRPDLMVDEEHIELLPVVPRPPKIICAASNYGRHAAEAGRKVPAFPSLFIRFARSLIADGESIVVPKASAQIDWEAELAIVIGKRGKHVSAADAYDHVAGYTIFNDVSVRDWQLRVSQFGAGKNFDATGPLGPELVTRDEVPDPHALEIMLSVNGEIMQASSTADMVFGVPALIEHISEFTTLEPGDVIATGTPEGVGHFRDPPVYLKPGDVVRVEIEGLGAQQNPVVAE
jgi:2-keto-4-pentenoate hydratase/2-oxohepta-3-ene-1,7-dioic acid hydratase in catechol pathway